MNFRRKDENGSALVATLVVMMALMVLGGALAQYLLLDFRQSVREERDLQAYYLARSGADAVAEWIYQNPSFAQEIIGKTSDRVNLGEGYFTTKVSDVGGAIEIESTGTVSGRSKTVVLALERQQSGFPFDMAVFAAIGGGSAKEPSIELKGNARIIGTTGTNAMGEGAIVFRGNAGIEGALLLRPGTDKEKVISPTGDLARHVSEGVGELPSSVSYPNPVLPEFPEDLPYRGDLSNSDLFYPIAEDGRYDSIKVTSNRTMTVDLQGGVRRIRVCKLDLQGTLELINVEPDGKLLLYVDEFASFNGGSKINGSGEGGGPGVLTLCFSGNNPSGGKNGEISLNGGSTFVGNVITGAPMIIGGGSGFFGNIIATDGAAIEVSGNATTQGVIYGPNAHVNLTGSGSTGAIVAYTLSASGNAEVAYDGSFSFGGFPAEVLESDEGDVIQFGRYQRSGWRPVR